MATTYELIASQVLGSDAATVTFSGIPGTYTDVVLVVSARTTRASTVANSMFYFNGTASNLSQRILWAYTSSPASTTSLTDSALSFFTSGDTATASTFGNAEIYIPNYAGNANKSVSWTASYSANSASDYNYSNLVGAGLWSNTAAISSITFGNRALDSANYKSGSSFYLYGITKA